MKCQSIFSGKKKEKYLEMLSADFFYPACRALKINHLTILMLCLNFTG